MKRRARRRGWGHRRGERCSEGPRRIPGGLRRRVFVALGVVITLTALTTAGTVALIHRSLSGGTADQRISRLVSQRFARVWDAPAARLTLAEDIAGALRIRVVLTDAEGAQLAEAGEGDGPVHTAAVHRGGSPKGAVLGHVTAHGVPWGPRWGLPIFLVVFLALLWWASGLLARRLVRPLEQLADVARDIGDGRLDSRAQLGHHAPGEVGHLARSINDMAERITQQLADQRALLAAVSHELRTPLGHLRILVEMAEDDADPAPRLAEMQAELQEMDTLVGELLASSRLDFSELHLREEDPLALAARALERKGLAADLLAAGPGLPERAAMDTTLLARALANLLDNAIKHGGGLEQLRVAREEAELRFEVCDLGQGFDPAAREQLFAPFVDGGSERSALGLGLSLVRRIAEAHGGRAFAKNRPEGGACFGIALPL